MDNNMIKTLLARDMNRIKLHSLSITYRCEVWSCSSDLVNLKLWFLLLPFTHYFTGLPSRRIRVTLLRSPLGNKTSKDQFEKREYRYHYYIESRDPAMFLVFIDLVSQLRGVKHKIIGQMGLSWFKK